MIDWIALRLISMGESGERSAWSSTVRGLGYVMLVLALVVTAATLLAGPFRIELPGGVPFRNHGIGRPLIIAAIGLVLAGGSGARRGRDWRVASNPPAGVHRHRPTSDRVEAAAGRAG